MVANPTDFDDWQLEMWDGETHFLHAHDCANYCDYACNHWGFEQAEAIRKLLTQEQIEEKELSI